MKNSRLIYSNFIKYIASVKLARGIGFFLRYLFLRIKIFILKILYKKIIFLICGPGLGDTLILSPIARRLREDGNKVIFVAQTRLSLNVAKRVPDFDDVIMWDPRLASIAKIINASFWNQIILKKKTKNLIDLCAEIISCGDIKDKTIKYRLSTGEERFALRYKKLFGDYLVFHTDCRKPESYNLKLWPEEYWQRLIDMQKLPIVIIGTRIETGYSFKNCIDLRNKTTIHQAAALIKFSRLLVGIVSVSVWFGNAFDKEAVIIDGGWEPPILTQYEKSHHLFTTIECSPCLRGDNYCPYDLKCMKMIAPESVNRKIIEVLGEKEGIGSL